MGLFNKFLNGQWYWAELVLWYILCLVAPHLDYTFDFKLFVHDFNQTGTLEWFGYDFSNILGIFLGFRGLFLFSNSMLYKVIAQVIMIDMTYEFFDLICLNNEFNLKSLIFENVIVIVAIIHAYKVYHK